MDLCITLVKVEKEEKDFCITLRAGYDKLRRRTPADSTGTDLRRRSSQICVGRIEHRFHRNTSVPESGQICGSPMFDVRNARFCLGESFMIISSNI